MFELCFITPILKKKLKDMEYSYFSNLMKEKLVDVSIELKVTTINSIDCY